MLDSMPYLDGRSTRRKPIIDGKKHCYKCARWKDVACFYPCKKSWSGLRARCKECDVKVVNEQHNGSLNRALRNLYIRHISNGNNGSKRRKQFTIEGCLSPEFIRELWDSQQGRCAMTGVPMTHVYGAGMRVWTNVTVDRIDPDRGYFRDNVRLVCKAVNYMKAAMTDREFFNWCVAVLNGPVATKS